jgi:hypothetical protein
MRKPPSYSPLQDAPSSDAYPTPEQIRSRLAEIAREQDVLRKVLKIIVRDRSERGIGLSIDSPNSHDREGRSGK